MYLDMMEHTNKTRSSVKGMDPKLYFAALSGSFQEMECVYDWNQQLTPNGNNILHIHIGKPIRNNYKDPKRNVSLSFIKQVFEAKQGYSLAWKKNKDGDTPLHLATRFKHKEVVKLFLKQAMKMGMQDVMQMVRMKNNKKNTILHEAARVGPDVVKLIVEADTFCVHEANEVGETPLYLAAESGYTASVATILDNCHPLAYCLDYKGPCGHTPLHAAVQWGDHEMVARILEKNKMLVRIQNNEGLTPLHCAAAKINKLKLLEILIKNDYNDESSASYIQDHMGRTALHIAMLQSNWGAIEKLISLRPDCIEIVDKNGQNVLHYAAKFTCLTKLYRLIGLGHIDKLTNEKDNDGNTPFHLLTSSMPKTPDYNMHDCLYYLFTFVKLIPFMDVKVFNNEKKTVGDIIYSFGNDMCPQKFIWGRYKQVERGGRIHNFERDLEVGKENSHDGIEEFDMVSIKKTAESRLVVAALIATVSFTAGFTLPGGFDQSIGQNMGMAVLKNKGRFKVFLISDTIAFCTSTLAILFYFVLVSAKSKWTIQNFSIMALICNTISFGALMTAFIAGVSVALSKSYRLFSAIISISMVFWFFYVYLVYRSIVFLVENIRRPRLCYWHSWYRYVLCEKLSWARGESSVCEPSFGPNTNI